MERLRRKTIHRRVRQGPLAIALLLSGGLLASKPPAAEANPPGARGPGDVEALASLQWGVSAALGVVDGQWYAGVLQIKSHNGEFAASTNTESYPANLKALRLWDDKASRSPRRLYLLDGSGRRELIAEADRIHGPAVPPRAPGQIVAWTERTGGSWSLRVWQENKTRVITESESVLSWPAVAVGSQDTFIACETRKEGRPLVRVFSQDGVIAAECAGRHPRLAAHGRNLYILSEDGARNEIRSKVVVVSDSKRRRVVRVPQADAYVFNGDIRVDPQDGGVYVVTESAPLWGGKNRLGALRRILVWHLSDGGELEPWPAASRNVVPTSAQVRQDDDAYRDWPAIRPLIFCDRLGVGVAFRKNRRYTGKHSFAWDLLLSRCDGRRDWSTPIRLTEQFCLPDSGLSLVSTEGGYLAAIPQYEHDGTWRGIRRLAANVYRFGRDHRLPPLAPKHSFGVRHAERYRDISLPPPDLKHRPAGKTLVWGDLHRHTTYSKCISSEDGMPDEVARFERDVLGCQVLCISDHGHHMSETEYLWVMDRLEAEADEHSIVLYGTEPNPSPGRHTNFYAVDPEIVPGMYRVTLSHGKKRAFVYRHLLEEFPQNSVIAIRHFHGGGRNPDRQSVAREAATHDRRLEPLMEAQQLRTHAMLASAEAPFGSFPNPLLDLGLKVGLVGGTDHSSGKEPNNFCLTGLWVDDTTEAAVWGAMKRRKTFSCANGKIALYATLDGVEFADNVKCKAPVEIKASASSARPLTRVGLMRDGTVLDWIDVEGTQVTLTLEDPDPQKGYHWYVVIAEAQSAYPESAAMGFLSPFFVTVE